MGLFSLLDPAFHPQSSNLMVCLVCRDLDVDKTISLVKQKNVSLTALVNHLRQHEDQYHQPRMISNASTPSGLLSKACPLRLVVQLLFII